MNSINDDPVKRLEARSYDVFKEPLTSLSPIRLFTSDNICSLEKALEPLVPLFPNLLTFAQTAKDKCSSPADGLTTDESASIMLYSMDWQPMDECLHYMLNAALRSTDRRTLTPWLPYLTLLFNSLSRLPSSSLTVYRHVKMNLTGRYPPQQRFPWYAFPFCTFSPVAPQSSTLRSDGNAYTRFIIHCHSAKDVRQHSYCPDEEQLLLPVASEFLVVSNSQLDNDHYDVQLEEMPANSALLTQVPHASNEEILSAHVLMKISEESIQSRSTVETIDKYIVRTTKLQKRIDQYPPRSAIDLVGEGLDDRDLSLVIQHAVIKKQCSILRLDRNFVTVQGTTMLAQSLETNRTLTGLNLSSNRLFDKGVQPLANVLVGNRSVLQKLHLGSNRISNEGVLVLAEMLKTNTTLHVLWLDNNRITDEGVHLLSNALVEHNRTLEELSLKKNRRITSASVSNLVDVIGRHAALKELDVSDCRLNSEDHQQLRQHIAVGRQFVLRCDVETDECAIS